MKASEAHGWLISDMISRHIWTGWTDAERAEDPSRDQAPPCPKCCGVCAAFFEYFNLPNGRAIAESYLRRVPKTAGLNVWQKPDDGVDWAMLEPMATRGGCPNHQHDDDDGE